MTPVAKGATISLESWVGSGSTVGVEMRVVAGVAVHSFPSADEEFRATAQQLVTETWERIHSIEGLIAEVEEALRRLYPEAVVRLKDVQAELGIPDVQTVYAFRDGRAA